MDQTANYLVKYVGGCKDGETSLRHVCGRHMADDHDHLGSIGHLYEFIGDSPKPTGIWTHIYADYRIACNTVDNFVTAMYIGDVTFEHGHPRGKPCHCWEVGLE